MSLIMGVIPNFGGRLRVSEIIGLTKDNKPIVHSTTVHMPPEQDKFMAQKADDLTGGETLFRIKLLKDDAKRLYAWLGDTLGRVLKAPESTVMVNTSNVRPAYSKYVSLHSELGTRKVGDVLLKMDLCE